MTATDADPAAHPAAPAHREVLAHREALAHPAAPVLDVVVPVDNEERALPGCLRALHAHLSEHLPDSFVITVVDNASTDTTLDVAAAVVTRPCPTSPAGLLSQVLRFAAVGVGCTLAYALLYLVLRQPLGGQAANLVALLLTAVANTGANRRFTFGVRGSAGAGRHLVQGLVVFAACWALTAGTLAGLHAAAPGASHGVEVMVLTVANLAGTVLRFLLLRAWVFHRQRVPSADWAG